MSVAIIELNDISLRGFHEGNQVASPGYVLLGADSIVSGEAAQRRNYLQPQQAFNQHWRQLSLSPLPTASRLARHYADLAYAQLLQLHTELGAPEQVVFAVPGSFSDDQLGILLGLANASPFSVTGLVDAAVADSAALPPGDYVYVDIQLHQALLTEISVTDRAARGRVEFVPDAGLKACHDAWAHHVADLYISQYRYDPLHTAAGEQQLHDRLPGWAGQLQQQPEVPVELETTRGALRLNLARNGLLQASRRLQETLQTSLQRLQPGRQVACSYRFGELAGLVLASSEQAALILEEESLLANCRANLDSIVSPSGEVGFVTGLPRGGDAPTANVADRQCMQRASHLLVNGAVAYAINNRLVLALSADGAEPINGARGHTHDAQIVVLQEGGGIRLESNGCTVQTRAALDNLQCGDQLEVDGIQLQFIEVR